jgi:hypothetical protein
LSDCVQSTFQLVRNSDAFSLLAVNSKARIKWGTVFIREIFDFFGMGSDEDGPTDPLFLVTIADKSHLTRISRSKSIYRKSDAKSALD